jgi:RNA polymerase sigma factor (sigma-70 family)
VEEPRAPPERTVPTKDQPLGADEGLALWQAIRSLPPRQRACIVLRYYEDLDDGEIAQLLGCRQGTVRSQIARAITKLRGITE